MPPRQPVLLMRPPRWATQSRLHRAARPSPDAHHRRFAAVESSAPCGSSGSLGAEQADRLEAVLSGLRTGQALSLSVAMADFRERLPMRRFARRPRTRSIRGGGWMAMFWPMPDATCSPCPHAARWTDAWSGWSRPRTSAGAAPVSPRTSTSTTAAIRRGPWSRSIWPASISRRSAIEVSGRQLAIAGERPVQETEGRVYQQVEIPSGPFRRIVELQVDVDAERAKATYEDGVLRIELPLRDPSETTRRVPIGTSELMEGSAGPRGGRVAARRRGRDPRRRAAARRAAGPAAARDRHLPRDPDPAGGRAGALDQAGQRRARRQPDAGHGRRPRPRERGARPGRPLRGRRGRRRRPHAQGPRRHACASSSRARSGFGSAPTSPRSPTWSRGSPSCPT